MKEEAKYVIEPCHEPTLRSRVQVGWSRKEGRNFKSGKRRKAGLGSRLARGLGLQE